MMKKFASRFSKVIVLAILATALMGCTPNDTKEVGNQAQEDTQIKEDISIVALKGPTGMGLVDIMEKSENDEGALNYNISLADSPDDIVGKIISKEVDIAAVPSNLALTLYNRTEGQVQIVAVNTLGVLYIVENGDTVNTMEDLKGRNLHVSGIGATPDFVLRYLLQENNLDIDRDLEVDFTLQNADLATALAQGDVDLALLPQPHVTTAMMRNEDLRIALDITKEYREASGTDSNLPMGAIIAQREFAENNKEALEKFLHEYKKSVDFVNSNQDEAAELIAKFEILPNPQVAKNAIPYSNIVFIDAMDIRSDLEEYYNILFNFEPKSIGGKMPQDDFYYQR